MISPQPRLTMLSFMAGSDIRDSLRRQAQWGLKTVDLKDALFGKAVTELTDEEAHLLASLIKDAGLDVHCLSTSLFWEAVETGEEQFRTKHLARVQRTIRLAEILKADCIRLLAPASSQRKQLGDAPAYLASSHPWFYAQFREACRLICDAGFQPVIENEVEGCVLTSPEEVCSFFEHLGSSARAAYIWDIQNMWQCGSYPSLAAYQKLKPYLQLLHLKGGIEDPLTRRLKYASGLEEATWPVREILSSILRDKRCSVVCLNPSHGERRPGFDGLATTQADVAFIRRHFPEVG